MLQKIKKQILGSKVVLQTIALSKRIVLPGFDKLPIYYVAIFFIRGIQKGLIATKASSMAFKFFLALFPTIIFLLTLIPHIPIDNFETELLAILEDLLPQSGYEFTKDTIVSLVTQAQDGLLSFGFLFAVYLATNGIDGMLLAFKDSYNSRINRNAIQQKLLSISLLFILTTLVVISIALIIITEYVVNFILEDQGTTATLILIGKWIIMASLCFFAISFIYYLGGDRTDKWRFFSAGSSLATLMVLLVSFGFGYYVDNFANYNKIYGSIGTIIVVMLWIYFNSAVLLIGFELNASIQQAGSIENAEKIIEK